jgi:hypothetical protein
MRLRDVCALVFLASCVTGPVERQRLADGSWHLTCRLPMDECVRHFEAVCMDKRYRILSAQSKRDVRDVDPGTREYRLSEITALCDRDAPQVAAAAAAPAPPIPPPGVPPPPPIGAPPLGAPPAPPPAGPGVARASACVPGATQACIGPGGCNGGQACRADGTGFGSCDCGAAKPAADAGP